MVGVAVIALAAHVAVPWMNNVAIADVGVACAAAST
jgi:hypothetical protein